MKYKIRELESTEWEKVLPIFEENGGIDSLPHPKHSRIVVAEDVEGRIVGFLTLQLAVHIEPLWIAPEHRGKLQPRKLLNKLLSLVPEKVVLWAFSSNNHIGRLIECMGFATTPYSVYNLKRR